MIGFTATAKTARKKQDTSEKGQTYSKEVPLKKEEGNSEASCLIAAGTEIEGQFEARENVRVDGLIVGQVKCAKRLAVGEQGRIEGTVEAGEMVLWGRVEGDVKIKGTLHIRSTGRLLGNIVAMQLIVDEGGRYEGECFVCKDNK